MGRSDLELLDDCVMLLMTVALLNASMEYCTVNAFAYRLPAGVSIDGGSQEWLVYKGQSQSKMEDN